MRIVIFGGTTEGRKLSEGFVKAGISHMVSVATEYGEMMLEENPLVTVHQGRMQKEEMKAFISDAADIVFDATHPYAVIVTDNIKEACRETGKEYIRILRDSDDSARQTYEGNCNNEWCGLQGEHASANSFIEYYEDTESCIKTLKTFVGNILLTTGSKELNKYSGLSSEKLYARVLPSEESIRLCEEAGIKRDHIIAMQGPFTTDLNKALISQYHIDLMVTKDSGKTGGYPEKIQAAQEMGIRVFVIGRPTKEDGIYVDEALERYAGLTVKAKNRTALSDDSQSKKEKDNSEHENDNNDNSEIEGKIYLIGIGPGDPDYLTLRAKAAIDSSDIVFGAERMIKSCAKDKVTYAYYLAKDVLPVIRDRKPKTVSILFSGDSGFFSGTEKMKTGLFELNYEIEIVPGISSLSYFAARIGVSYSDSIITSIHGKSKEEGYINKLVEDVLSNRKVFTLLSGKEDVNVLIEALMSRFQSETKGTDLHAEGKMIEAKDIRITLGYELSYPNEEITEFTLDECFDEDVRSKSSIVDSLPKGLYVALIENLKI